jgi:hypothetical protein
MNVCESITWGRRNGRLVPIAVTYVDRVVVESHEITVRDIGASAPQREVKVISLPTITAFSGPIPEVPPPSRGGSVMANAETAAKDERIARIREAHLKLRRRGLFAERGVVEEMRA